MNSKRSYLDTLNAGRQRRQHSALEQINHSLNALERRLEQTRTESAAGPGRLPPVEPRYPQAASQGQAGLSQSAYRQAPSYRSIARDLERVRGQEEDLTAVGKIASELRSLRDELRQQMTTGLHHEFDALRRDMESAFRSAPAARDSAALEQEFERLSSAIQTLAARSDDRSCEPLRLELEQMRAALDTLAREESVQKADRRWDDFYRRWNAFEDRIDADSRRRGDGPQLAVLFERLEQIGSAVENLPESLSLRSLEEKVRTLAGAVDHFASQQGGRDGRTLGLIDERLDEISRAIVASTVAAQSNTLDPAALDRVEQRIAALAGQIEEVSESRRGGELLERLGQLSSRVDDLAARMQAPEQAIDRLTQQIAAIAEKVQQEPALPDAEEIVRGIEQRFDVLANMIERRQGDAMEHGTMLFRDLERRLDEVTERLDRHAGAAMDGAGIMEAIDARFNALAERLETHQPEAPEAAMRELESRLQDISTRLDSSSAQMAAIDPDLIRSLEAQVTSLSAHLTKPGTPLPDFKDIAPRIARIEQAVASSRDSILEAAREAAENAVRSLGPEGAETPAVAGLAEDLKTLEALTRRSDERNAKTFEAIHDTLLKIVDRLGSLESPIEQPRQPDKIAVHDAPSLEMGEPAPLAEPATDAGGGSDGPMVDAPLPRTPAEAAADAARAALGDEPGPDRPERGRRKSMLGGLARRFSRKEQETAQAEPGPAAAPEVSLDEPLEPKLLNRPLEPGSGAPDLSAIMKRVRDERSQPARLNESDAAKADFIAAARRAAQAAAAEADALKRQSTVSGPVKALRIGDLFKARRKPLLMAAGAIMLALAGLQLGKAFLADSQQAADAKQLPIVAEEAAEVASADTVATMPDDDSAATDQAEADGAISPVRLVGQASSSDAQDKELATVEETAPAPVQSADARASEITAPSEAAAAAAFETGPMQPDPETVAALPAAQPPQPMAANLIDIPAEVGPAALREAAAEGDARALFEIGSRYAEGRGVKEDMAEAARWYERAAERGLPVAEYRIGNFYEKGIGVERDIEKSKMWYQRAAEQGNASAMHNLAVLFAMAAGDADNRSAAHWFQEAADLGVKDSQFNLGILTAKGVGMKQDLEQSYKWFALVAKTGDKDAADKRDEIAKALRPEQLERARAAAELWKAKPLDQIANGVDLPEAWQDAPAATASIDMTKAVRNIQRILNKNGYDAGAPDGIMGNRTKNAIMAFQADQGMEATGAVDEALVEALLARK